MKRLKFLVSLPTGDNDFQVEQAASAEQAALKLGIDLNVTYSDNDTVNQSTQILKAIQSPIESRPQGIVFEPVHSSALPQVARVACEAGVGWAVLNRAPNYLSEIRGATKAPAFALSSSHVEIGVFKESNLLHCCRRAVRSFILKGLPTAFRPRSVLRGCWKRNIRTSW